MDFDYDTAFASAPAEAYETLLLDALRGDATNFTRTDAVEQSWRIVDPLIESWAHDGRRAAPVRGRHLGARCGRRHARARRQALAAPVSGVSVEEVESALATLRREHLGTRRAAVRTSLLDLVAVCDDDALAAELQEAVEALPSSRPSRALLALVRKGDGPVEFKVQVFAHNTGGDELAVFSESVSLVSGGGGAPLPSLIAGLLLPDLPVVLLWRARPRIQSALLKGLWPLATRIVVDSTGEPGTLEALHVLIAREPRRPIGDLSWTKIQGWRETVARMFDVPENVRALGRLQRISIRHVGPADAQARLLGAWVRSRTGIAAPIELTPEERDDMRSGSITSVTLDCAGTDYRVERVDEGIARLDAPLVPSQNVRIRVPQLRHLLALELEQQGSDPAFEDAVRALSASPN